MLIREKEKSLARKDTLNRFAKSRYIHGSDEILVESGLMALTNIIFYPRTTHSNTLLGRRKVSVRLLRGPKLLIKNSLPMAIRERGG